MYYTRIFADVAGDSHFEEVKIELSDKGIIGYLSEKFEVKSIQFRENKANYNWDFHTAPIKQFIILLNGEIEITSSLNIVKLFKAGDILLLEDTSGKGHKTKNSTQSIRNSLFIQL